MTRRLLPRAQRLASQHQDIEQATGDHGGLHASIVVETWVLAPVPNRISYEYTMMTSQAGMYHQLPHPLPFGKAYG